MKLEDALLTLHTFLLKVQGAKTIDDVKELHPEFEEVNKIPSLFEGKNLKKVNKRLKHINKAIETVLVNVMNVFLQKLQATDSLEGVNILILECSNINDCSNMFRGNGMEQIQLLREKMISALKQTLLRLTLQNPHETKETKETKETETPKEKPLPKTEEPWKTNPVRSYELFHVRKMIGILREKATALKDNDQDTPASIAANTLCDDIATCAAEYESDMIDLETFKKRAHLAILISHDELDKPRGYCVKHILANLAFAVLTLGIGYLIAAAYKGTLFPISPNTDSANKVDLLDSAVNTMVAAK